MSESEGAECQLCDSSYKKKIDSRQELNSFDLLVIFEGTRSYNFACPLDWVRCVWTLVHCLTSVVTLAIIEGSLIHFVASLLPLEEP